MPIVSYPSDCPAERLSEESPTSPRNQVALRRVRPGDAAALGDFFERIGADSASAHFHPHPITREYAVELSAGSDRRDEYLVATEDDRVVGYAMLRGWDEGYAVPAFGVAVDPERRGAGLGRALLEYALARARERGAEQVMLKVHPDNLGAKHLYESVGFKFEGHAPDGVQLLGVLTFDAVTGAKSCRPATVVTAGARDDA